MKPHPLLTSLVLTLAGASPAAYACSFFMCAREGVVLVGNNEDYVDPHALMWFIPADEGSPYGRVLFGYRNHFPQGGMNDQGLFFDGASAPRQVIEPRRGLEPYVGNLIHKAMAECATVEEVIALFERFDVPDFFKVAQLMFTDKSGDSAILEGDHVLRKQGDYQITTNFYQSERRAKPYPWRYATIDGMLSAGTVPTVDDFRGILAASHQEGRISTIYSNIYDLKAGLVHLYHFHNFEEVVTIDLAAELAKGRHEVEIASLFPESFAFATFKARHGD